MLYGFKTGAAEALRLAKQYAANNGMAAPNCIDAQPHDPTCAGMDRQKGLVTWTVRFDGLPRGPLDDGSVILLVDLASGEVRTLGRPSPPCGMKLRSVPLNLLIGRGERAR